MAACSSQLGRHLILLLGVCFLILGSYCVPISRTKTLMLMDVSSSSTDHRLISGNTNLVDESWEIEKMGGRMNYLEVIDLFGAKMESLLGIVVEEGNRYHRMSSFMMKVLKRVTGNDHYLVYKVSSSIRRTHWSLYDLGDLVVDRHCKIDKEHVSDVIQDYRSKVINELKELHDNLSTDSSNTTTKQMIKDYIVAFEGGVDSELPVDDDLAKKLHKSEDLQMMILLNYAPIKKMSSTIISKKSDDEMITNKRQRSSVEGQFWPSRSRKRPKYIYQEDEDDLDTWDCGADSVTPCSA